MLTIPVGSYLLDVLLTVALSMIESILPMNSSLKIVILL